VAGSRALGDSEGTVALPFAGYTYMNTFMHHRIRLAAAWKTGPKRVRSFE
jgi:hypothetical protein